MNNNLSNKINISQYAQEYENPYSTEIKNNYKTGYKDIDSLSDMSADMINKSMQIQNNAIDQNTNTQVEEIQRQKDVTEQNTTKLNKSAYNEYKQATNSYGVNQETLAGNGMSHSGASERARSRIYNNYQKAVVTNINNLKNAYAEYDAQMAEVRSAGDIEKAKNISNGYIQQIEQIKVAHELAQKQKEFEYQKQIDKRDYNYKVKRDKVTDKQWQKDFDYRKKRDKVSDKQWEKEYKLAKKG